MTISLEDMTRQRQTSMSLRWRLLFIALFFGSAGYFGYEGDWILAVTSVVTGLAAMSGYRVGAVYGIVWLIAFASAISFAPAIGQSQEWRFTQWFETTGLYNRILAVGAVGTVIVLGVGVVLTRITGAILENRPRLDAMNRWLGFALGGVEGVAIVAMTLGGALLIEPAQRQRADEFMALGEMKPPVVTQAILITAEKTRESRIGPILEEYNPLDRFPELNKIRGIQQTTQLLSDPAKIKKLLHHPQIVELQQRPEVQRVMAELEADPEVQEILYSGKKMDKKMAMSLLKHPAVLELVDQPGFLEEAAEIIRDLDPAMIH